MVGRPEAQFGVPIREDGVLQLDWSEDLKCS